MPPQSAAQNPQEPKQPEQPPVVPVAQPTTPAAPAPAPKVEEPVTPGAIDIDAILLPKKESGPNPESAGRMAAGALVAQEQNATLPKPEPAPTPAPAPAPAPQEGEGVAALQTYRGDVERVVTDKNISAISIAAAEAERRGKTGTPEERAAEVRAWGKTLGYIAIGLVLITIAVGAVAYVALRPTTTPVATTPQAPFISIDEARVVSIPTGEKARPRMITALTAARQKTNIPIGLIEWLYLTPEPVTTEQAELPIQDLIFTLSPRIPQELLRTIEGRYLVGVHSFDDNQPFLLMNVDSYSAAYAGMLAWERDMFTDLAPFFTRNAPERVADSVVAASTTPQFLDTGFVDRVVENRDTRVVENASGDIVLLWTMLGRNIVLVTSNEYTLREVLSRMQIAPVVPNTQ